MDSYNLSNDFVIKKDLLILIKIYIIKNKTYLLPEIIFKMSPFLAKRNIK